jgi:hypothetical protein
VPDRGERRHEEGAADIRVADLRETGRLVDGRARLMGARIEARVRDPLPDRHVVRQDEHATIDLCRVSLTNVPLSTNSSAALRPRTVELENRRVIRDVHAPAARHLQRVTADDRQQRVTADDRQMTSIR